MGAGSQDIDGFVRDALSRGLPREQIAAALVSALADRPLAEASVWFGEVALSGEVRPVAHGALRLREAEKLGFSRAFGPADAGQRISGLDYRSLGQVANLVDRVMAKP